MNQKKLLKYLFIVIVIIAFVLTSYIIYEKYVIYSFVKNVNFPKQQKVVTILSIPQKRVTVFDVDYGQVFNLASIDYYSYAIGIKSGNKIGWIDIYDRENIDKSKIKMYNFDASDRYLYSDEFFELFSKKSSYGTFLSILIKGKNVPSEVKQKAQAEVERINEENRNEYVGW